MSDTPRTDAATWHQRISGDPLGLDVTAASFAAGLERELNEANARIKQLEEALNEIIKIRNNAQGAGQYMTLDSIEKVARKAKGAK